MSTRLASRSVWRFTSRLAATSGLQTKPAAAGWLLTSSTAAALTRCVTFMFCELLQKFFCELLQKFFTKVLFFLIGPRDCGADCAGEAPRQHGEAVPS